MTVALRVEPLPGLEVMAVCARFAADLDGLAPLPSPGPPDAPDEALRVRVREVLRQRGYRPTGRGKPSSEYLVQALAEGRFPRINAAVDAGNRVSLATGLPISVVDLDLLRPPLVVQVADASARYVFNRSGQEIDVGGLPCLFDADGPCANAVKDAQRTKTRGETRAVLGIVWGVHTDDRERVARATAALARQWQQSGAEVTSVAMLATG